MTRYSLRIARISAACLLALASACGNKGAPAPETAAAAAPPDPLEIKADANLMERIRVGEAVWAQVGAEFTVAARVEVDERRITRVGAPVMGRIGSLAVEEGEQVTRGQLLAQLNSAGLSDAQLAFLKALSQRQVEQRSVERGRVLLEAGVIGAAEVQRREAELVQATAELDAARDQLLLLGMPAEALDELGRTRRINSLARVVASMDGTVLDRKVTIGQMVQPADTVFEIADLSNVWLVADVPEQYAGHLQVGLAVEAEIGALPGQKISGKLSFVGATVNPETRTVRARIDLPNPAKRLKPAMLATMTLKDHTEKRRVVPSSAVVREGNAEHVFVQRAEGVFALREVDLEEEARGQRVVRDGLREGEKIVVHGAFHLNNERRRRVLRGAEGG